MLGEKPLASLWLSGRAKSDLLAIAEYGAERWGPEAADRFLDGFEEAFQLIERHPDIGRVRDELGSNRRSWSHRGYVVFYTRVDDGLEVNRILHAAADWIADFDPEEP